MTIDEYPKFLPEWTNAIEQINKKTFGLIPQHHSENTAMIKCKQRFELNWMSGACCLTGEAFFHHYAPTHTCIICSVLTYDSTYALVSTSKLYKYKKELAEHLIESHPEIWNEWKEKMA